MIEGSLVEKKKNEKRKENIDWMISYYKMTWQSS